MPSALESEDPYPLAADFRWRDFRNAHLGLLVRRASRADGDRGADDASPRAVLERLAALSPRAGMAGSVFEAGWDMGRLVYARPIVDDTLAGVIGALSRQLDAAGVGLVEARDVFHRSALVGLAPGPAAVLCAPDLLGAYVAGVLAGTVGEAMNCRVAVRARDARAFDVRLGEGRDVNSEVGFRG